MKSGSLSGYTSCEFVRELWVVCNICTITLKFTAVVIFVMYYRTAPYKESTVCLISLCEDVQRAEHWGDFCHANAEEYFTFSKLFARGVIWLRCQLTVYLHLYIWMSVCSQQMASVSHLYPCLFTDAMVSNVFSVAFRSVMMIHSYVWEKICIYFCTEKI